MKEDQHIDVVRRYFDACNSGLLEDFKPTLADDVVHYFLPDRFAPIRGADHLARFWRKFKQVSDTVCFSGASGAIPVSHFLNLNQAIDSMATDPSTASQPIKRMFIADGDFVSANVSILEKSGDALHTQASHDEIVVVLEGDVDFRVGDETRRVGPGDFIFIPRNTLHGPIIEAGQRFAALSVFAPFFDRSKENIDWERDQS